MSFQRAIRAFALANCLNRAVFLSGGYSGDFSKKVFAFDVAAGRWLSGVPDLNRARYMHSSCALNHKVYVLCGLMQGDKYLNQVEMLDTS